MKWQSDARGLTLVELLVALSVFALLSAGGIAMLRGGFDSRQSVTDSMSGQQRIQILRAVLRADLTQMVDRPARMETGNVRPWRFLGTERGGQGLPVMAFVRGGWDNPGMRASRSELVYIEYDLADGRLIRRLYPRPDVAPDTPVVEQVLLEGLDDLRLRYLLGGVWQRRLQAPPDRRGGLPAAVEVAVTHPDTGSLRMLFLAAGQGA